MKKRYFVLAGITAAVVALALVWDWDWFIPLAQARATAALGRKVTISHVHVVQIGWRPILEADGITVANPDGFPADSPFASVGRLQVQLDIPAYWHDRSIVLPVIAVDRPVVDARALPDGTNNWTLKLSSASDTSSGAAPRIGDLRITDGNAHVVVPKVKSDFTLAVATREAAGKDGEIVVDAKGTYAGQPITGRFIGGALLSLRDAANPYPVDLNLANGPTQVSLAGTVQNPVAFAGADLKLRFTGPDLSLLFPLTGIAIPQTPSYELSGQLDYADRKIRLHGIQGRVGSSDLEGDIDVAPGDEREMVTATLSSRQVDLADLGGFVGSTPGRMATPDQTPAQRAALARAEANPRLIPDTPINLPKLRAADVDLHYRGAKILGRSIPFDSLDVALTIKDGKLDLHPVSLGIGRGNIAGNIALDGAHDTVNAHADIDFRQIDLGRLMAATHTFTGAGLIGGRAVLDGSGNSLGALLGQGNGELKLFMSSGGDLSALLVDLSGLEFGNALLSALGIPDKAQLRCLVTDFVLQRGVLDTRTFLVDTSEANITGTGSVNLRDETVDYQLRTEAKHFSIGSLPAPIDISGKLKSPSIRPDAVALGARAGAAVGLGILLTPLGALLPTIQLGLGEDNNCAPLIRSAEAPPHSPPQGRPPRAVTR